MYVADGRNNCIQIFSVEGKFRRIFSGPVEPQSIAIDTNDIVYVSESYKGRSKQANCNPCTLDAIKNLRLVCCGSIRQEGREGGGGGGGKAEEEVHHHHLHHYFQLCIFSSMHFILN